MAEFRLPVDLEALADALAPLIAARLGTNETTTPAAAQPGSYDNASPADDDQSSAVDPWGEPVPQPDPAPPAPQSNAESLDDKIRAATSQDQIEQLWRAHKDVWTAENTRLAVTRKKQLGK